MDRSTMVTLQEIYYTPQNKHYTDEEAERKARKVRDILIGEMVMILHNSDDLNSADQDILSGNVCQTITEYFDDEYGV